MTARPDFYFDDFETREPPQPLPHRIGIESAWQVMAIAALVLGAWYLHWRWTASLNTEALWLSLPVVIAESLAYFGLILFVHNLWSVRDTPQADPPSLLSDVREDVEQDRPITVDIFLPTFNEDPELTRLSIQDAKAVTYPGNVEILVHVLDDGRREAMRKVALEEGVNYITRPDNTGYKAGNLRNGMAHTSGDFMVILDSDTRPFPNMLREMLGYFRDPDVAWVQSPQWFYDVPDGQPFGYWMTAILGFGDSKLKGLVQRFAPAWHVGRDPFGSDPQLFYDIILRRRNRANASFCCGAGSIHRRSSIVHVALRDFSENVTRRAQGFCVDPKIRAQTGLMQRIAKNLSHGTELTPYKFHVSEDIYTSIILQKCQSRRWKSVYHPQVLSKMLSPQDIQSWAIQRFKYAGGSLDILWNDNPITKQGLSIAQKLHYGATFWSYLAAFWKLVFLLAPLIGLVTATSPVGADTWQFFIHFLPFLIAYEIAVCLGTWGVYVGPSRRMDLAMTPLTLRAILFVLLGREIKFKVTPKTAGSAGSLRPVLFHILIVAFTPIALGFGLLAVFGQGAEQDIDFLIINGLWCTYNAVAMGSLISAALWKPPTSSFDVKNRLTSGVFT
ncbi:MAG: cellulose synthase catalytic subunit [Pseudomonadota bacterium]